MLPGLAEKGYTLTENLEEVKGFLLYFNNKAIGSIGLKHINAETCEIERVFVCEEFRGKGYSRLLFDKIEEYARKLGYKSAEMITWTTSTAALGLYKKLGYSCSEEKQSEWLKGSSYVELYKAL